VCGVYEGDVNVCQGVWKCCELRAESTQPVARGAECKMKHTGWNGYEVDEQSLSIKFVLCADVCGLCEVCVFVSAGYKLAFN
jgi:hypothetical protein